GQAVHFKHHAPKDLGKGLEYAHNRYQFEAQRHYGILNDHLANSRYMVGDTYTIVDMAFWGWARLAPYVLGKAGGCAGDRAERQVCLQDRNGRRGAQHHVPSSQDQGGMSRLRPRNGAL